MSKPSIEVCFTPSKFDLYYDNQEIVVVIDVLRATSAICTAFDYGVSKIIPVSTVEEARAYQEKGFLAGAERDGQIVEGFEFGNSPFSYMKGNVKGETIVLTTTNGTKAINIAKVAPQVLVGALLNLDALIAYLIKQNKSVLCLCSGWKEKFNLEDTLCAGAIAKELVEKAGFAFSEDSTIGAVSIFEAASLNNFRFLKASSHRRRLRNLNLNKDVIYCLQPNQSVAIPYLNGDALELLAY